MSKTLLLFSKGTFPCIVSWILYDLRSGLRTLFFFIFFLNFKFQLFVSNVIGLFLSIGVYADGDEIKNLLGDKYEKLSSSELMENKEFNDDILESDISMTVRLQIVYSRLSIRSVRSAFEESVGKRLQKFGGSNTGDLLQR